MSDVARLAHVVQRGDAGARDVAVALLLAQLPLTDLPRKLAEAKTGAAGPVDWLLPDLVESLRRYRMTLDAVGRDAQATNSLTLLI